MSLEVTDRFPGVNVRLDHSLRIKPKQRSRLPHSSTDPDMGPTVAAPISQLPTAVANVPEDDLHGYAHTKKVYNYFVGTTLGEGSFAKVKEAFNILVGEKVAMKVIDKKKALQDAYVAKNFKREARLLQKVRHPNIVQLYEVIETENNYYLITELCTGGELMGYIEKHHHLSEDETRKYTKQIVSAVDHLHRAGILHRDLKVENLLLDHNKDIKLIDFGLSNEEYIKDSESGEELHCRTQCGSPAYAAPELLGQKEYDKSVDVWSIGVNMYAMLTGALPYTVEPFNITALHAKMLQNKMNPIPSHLTDSCKDLVKRMLVPNPERRISMADVFQHQWLSEKSKVPFQPAPYPNRIAQPDINEDIIEHMVAVLKVDTAHSIKQDLLTNRATSSSAIYHLISSRLARYKRDVKKKRPVKRLSKDHGYYEGADDAMSVATVPTYLPSSDRRRRAESGTEVLMRSQQSRRPRPISGQFTNETPQRQGNYTRTMRHREDRRYSVPHESTLSEYQKILHQRETRPTGVYTTQPSQRIKKMSLPSDPLEHDLQPVEQPMSSGRYVAFSPRKIPLPKSFPDRLDRQNSESFSLDPLNLPNEESLDSSHQVGFFIESPSNSRPHLPQLYPTKPPKNEIQANRRKSTPGGLGFVPDSAMTRLAPSPHDNYRTKSPARIDSPARKISPITPSAADYHLKSDLPVYAVIGELKRVADTMHMKQEMKIGDKLRCRHNHMSFQVSVTKANRLDNSCTLHFEWLSGGSHGSFENICQEMMQRITV